MQQPPVVPERERGNEPVEDEQIGPHGPIGTNASTPTTIESPDTLTQPGGTT